MSNETLKPLGFVDTSDSVHWRDAYPEYSESQLIGKALAGRHTGIYRCLTITIDKRREGKGQ